MRINILLDDEKSIIPIITDADTGKLIVGVDLCDIELGPSIPPVARLVTRVAINGDGDSREEVVRAVVSRLDVTLSAPGLSPCSKTHDATMVKMASEEVEGLSLVGKTSVGNVWAGNYNPQTGKVMKPFMDVEVAEKLHPDRAQEFIIKTIQPAMNPLRVHQIDGLTSEEVERFRWQVDDVYDKYRPETTAGSSRLRWDEGSQRWVNDRNIPDDIGIRCFPPIPCNQVELTGVVFPGDLPPGLTEGATVVKLERDPVLHAIGWHAHLVALCDLLPSGATVRVPYASMVKVVAERCRNRNRQDLKVEVMA